MPQMSHTKAAESHEKAAKSHRAAAEQHAKGHDAAQEHTEKAAMHSKRGGRRIRTARYKKSGQKAKQLNFRASSVSEWRR